MLSTKQRQYLKGLAHSLDPIVRVGKAGVTDAVVNETKQSLEAHELIKVRIDADDRKPIAENLASATDAQIVNTIGKIAILYRQREEKPKIKLPG